MYLINSLICSILKYHNRSFAVRKLIPSLLLIPRLCICSKTHNLVECDVLIFAVVVLLSCSLYSAQAGPLNLIVSDHISYICLAVPYMPFIFTSQQNS